MAGDIPGDQYSLPAYADYRTNQYHAVYLYNSSNTGYARLCYAGAASAIFGILQDLPDAQGVPCSVMTHGKSYCVYGGSVSVGDNLTTDASGHLVTSSAPTTDVVCGVAGITGDSGDIGEVYLDIQSGSAMGVSAGAPTITPVRIPLNNITTGAAIATGIPCSGTGKLIGAFAFPDTVATLSSKLATITVSTSSGAVTGGVIALTSALCKGVAAIPATAISGTNAALTSSVTITLTASSVTSFSGDSGYVTFYFVTTA